MFAGQLFTVPESCPTLQTQDNVITAIETKNTDCSPDFFAYAEVKSPTHQIAIT